MSNQTLSVEQVRDFLASGILSYDPMYQASMDTAWHHWVQPKYDEQRRNWEAKLNKPNFE